MKQSNWMKGLLWAEEECTNLMLGFKLSKVDAIESLKSSIEFEEKEYLANHEWVKGAWDYIKLYEGEL